MEAMQIAGAPPNTICQRDFICADGALQPVDGRQHVLHANNAKSQLLTSLAYRGLQGLGRAPSSHRKASGEQSTSNTKNLGCDGCRLAEVSHRRRQPGGDTSAGLRNRACCQGTVHGASKRDSSLAVLRAGLAHLVQSRAPGGSPQGLPCLDPLEDKPGDDKGVPFVSRDLLPEILQVCPISYGVACKGEAASHRRADSKPDSNWRRCE
mmetsp:Transcript_2185/g.5074  ORF Transcript_2185/g.5074 Transcript_2185/m.5074 type:complete len:209 (+) Transcript_2185:424-1050(+)